MCCRWNCRTRDKLGVAAFLANSSSRLTSCGTTIWCAVIDSYRCNTVLVRRPTYNTSISSEFFKRIHSQSLYFRCSYYIHIIKLSVCLPGFFDGTFICAYPFLYACRFYIILNHHRTRSISLYKCIQIHIQSSKKKILFWISI